MSGNRSADSRLGKSPSGGRQTPRNLPGSEGRLETGDAHVEQAFLPASVGVPARRVLPNERAAVNFTHGELSRKPPPGEDARRPQARRLHSFYRSTLETFRSPSTQSGYTRGMKTAVSIPDEVFEKVERLARREKRSRSEVFSAALREYVARHNPDEITDAINRVCDQVGDQRDEFVAAAARRVLEKTEW